VAPAPIPDPWVVGAKAGILLFSTSHNYLHDLLDYLEDRTESEGTTWRHLAVHYHDTDNPTPADDRYITFDLAKIDGGHLDDAWVTGDYTTAETALTAFLTSTANVNPSHIQVVGWNWYVRSFNPYTESKPFAPHGPPVRVQTVSMSGTGTGRVPAQCAISVTEKTAMPHHWGRFFLPAAAATDYGSDGRVDSSVRSEIANAAATMYSAWSHAGLVPVVASTQTNKTPTRQLLTVDHITVDDVPDVIRTRRLHGVSSRTTVPIS
jgi:hypothetical protein